MTRARIVGLVLANRARLHPQAEGDVLEHRHVAEQRVVLEHEADMALAGAARQRILAVERHLAGIGPVEARDDPQQRGLAGAGRAEQRQQFAVADLQIDVVERGEGAELLDDVLDFNGHSELCPSSRRRSRTVFATSVISASSASSDAIANDATN